MSEYKRQNIGRERAIALSKREWWKGKTARELAEFQMLTEELCVPFDTYHVAVEEAIGRPVFTHELALNWQGIAKELFDGAPPPSLESLLNLIAADKQIIIQL